MKAYIASSSENGIDNIDGVYFLITEEGELLASHICSNKSIPVILSVSFFI